MKKALLSLVALATCTFSLAASTAPIEETFQRYWTAFASQDFAKAAADVLPSDLEDAKKQLLPVFLEAQKNSKKEVQEMVTTFFGRSVGKAREAMSPVDVFAGLNRIASLNNPDMFVMLKEATTSIIFVRQPAENEAEIHFQVMLRGVGDIDAESLTKKNGRWWIRLGDDPQELAAQFKALFAKQS